MPRSIADREIQAVLDHARAGQGRLFPSPADWRDQWIYFLMLDRFNNPGARPNNLPYNAEFNQFQGGRYNGVRDQLKYLQQLGVGAIWLSPVLKNPQFDKNAYHGYGIQNFLAAEPRFASNPDKAESELRQLVDAASGRIALSAGLIRMHARSFSYMPSPRAVPVLGQPVQIPCHAG